MDKLKTIIEWTKQNSKLIIISLLIILMLKGCGSCTTERRYEYQINKYETQIDSLKAEIENKKSELEIVEKFKTEIEGLNNTIAEANEKTEVAEKLASDFQNKLYDLQLKNIELEQELNYIKHSGELLKK